jgi:hypothetical protein
VSEFLKGNDEQISKQNVTKEVFNWDIPVESVPLPSEGKIYSPNTTLYNRKTIPIKAMTAHEEDILTSQAYIKEGTVINELIKSCVTDKSFSINDMIIGDRNALMVAIRITGYGSDYKVTTACQNCNHVNNVTVGLSELPIKRLKLKPTEDGKNEFSFQLPVSKKNVHFKFMTMKDDTDRAVSQKNTSKLLNLKMENNVTSFLSYSIISIEGVTDRNKINHFIKAMPAYDSKSLRNHIKNHEPGMEMTDQFSCKNCGHHNEFAIPVTSEFFWPGT